MDYSREIILACEAGKKELDAIKNYTEKLEETYNSAMREIYKDNRLDELPHIQNIVVAITAMINGKEPVKAEEIG